MFHVDLTFEDTRIILDSVDGSIYNGITCDNLTGDTRSVCWSAKDLSMIFAFNMHPDGEPEGFEQFYTELEPLFEGCPVHLRPIP